MIGRTLAHYEIVSLLGRGGMGDVYRATDQRLGREVALKVLPKAFAADTERMARFEREARVLASLNHPNVAHLYGLESAVPEGDVPESEATTFLVMELVEGEDLSTRIARGALDADEVISLAVQLAEALAAAHEAGVIHRDLKPANVKLTADGRVKVLDFGLAKSWQADGSDPALSPTITHHATVEGVILGTAGYMAPEQARGKPVDRRADVWAFGVVVWEMLTGRRLFQGDTATDVLAAVVRQDIDLGVLPADTPPALRRVLRRCLERDPDLRLRDIGDARLELVAPLEESVVGTSDEGGRRSAARGSWIVAGAILLGLVAVAFALRTDPPAPSESPRRFDVAPAQVEVRSSQLPSISPDGTKALWVAEGALWVRDFGAFDPVRLPGTEGARFPFWAPDSEAVAFVRDDRVWRSAIGGSDPVAIGILPPDSMTGSGAGLWREDGRIFLAGSHLAGLYALSGRGDEATVEEELRGDDEADFHHVAALPGSDALIVSVHTAGTTHLSLQVLTDEGRQPLSVGSALAVGAPAYAPSGHLVFERLDTNPGIWAVPFSAERLATTGPPFLVVAGGRMPSLSNDGTLLYVRDGRTVQRRLVSMDRGGRVEDLLDETRTYEDLRLSPDGRSLLFSVDEAQGVSLWILELDRRVATCLSNDGSMIVAPTWTPDGRRILFSSEGSDRGWDIYSMTTGGVIDPVPVYDSSFYAWPNDVTSDGRFLVFSEFDRSNQVDVRMMDLGSGEVTTLAEGPTSQSEAALSPDGRWIAYVSYETGQEEVYVRPLAAATGKVQASDGGGEVPVWSRSGEFLFFRQGDRILRVRVSVTDSQITLGRQEEFAGGFGEQRDSFIGTRTFDVDEGASRIFTSVIDRDIEASPRLGVVFGFAEELERLSGAAPR